MPARRRLSIFMLLLSLGWFLGFGWVQAGPLREPPSEADFWQLVTDTRSAAGQTGVDAEKLESLAQRWDSLEEVQTESGQVVLVDGSIWVSLLRANPPDLAQLESLLSALEREQNLLGQPGLPPNSLALLDEILARPEFQWESRAPGWLEDLWNRFLEWLFSLFGDSQAEGGQPGVGGADLLTILSFVVIAAVLAYTLRSMFSDFVSEAALEANAEYEEPLSARTALNRADMLSKSGDYRSAVRYLYLSSLLILDERGLLYYDRTKTNREYLRSLAGNAKIAGLLREVIGVFDRVWYGFQPVDEETYQHYAAQVRELENQP